MWHMLDQWRNRLYELGTFTITAICYEKGEERYVYNKQGIYCKRSVQQGKQGLVKYSNRKLFTRETQCRAKPF